MGAMGASCKIQWVLRFALLLYEGSWVESGGPVRITWVPCFAWLHCEGSA